MYIKEPPPPEKLRLYRTSPTTIIVRWEEPKRNNIIAAYRIFYYKHQLEDFSVWDKITTDGPTTTALLSDLDSHQSYAVCVQSKSVNGRWSNRTNVVVTNFLPLGKCLCHLLSTCTHLDTYSIISKFCILDIYSMVCICKLIVLYFYTLIS